MAKYQEVKFLQYRTYEGNQYKTGDKANVPEAVANELEYLGVAKKTGKTADKGTEPGAGNPKGPAMAAYDPREEVKENTKDDPKKAARGPFLNDKKASDKKGSKKKKESAEIEGLSPSEFPKPLTGGYYELSNGEKVKGKEKALEEQKKVDGGK